MTHLHWKYLRMADSLHDLILKITSYMGLVLQNTLFLEFVVDTYEEAIPLEIHNTVQQEMVQEVDDTEDEGDSELVTGPAKKGCWWNGQSYYLPSHPKHLSICCIIWSANHTTLSTVVGPFFSRNKDKQEWNFYCALITLARYKKTKTKSADLGGSI